MTNAERYIELGGCGLSMDAEWAKIAALGLADEMEKDARFVDLLPGASRYAKARTAGNIMASRSRRLARASGVASKTQARQGVARMPTNLYHGKDPTPTLLATQNRRLARVSAARRAPAPSAKATAPAVKAPVAAPARAPVAKPARSRPQRAPVAAAPAKPPGRVVNMDTHRRARQAASDLKAKNTILEQQTGKTRRQRNLAIGAGIAATGVAGAGGYAASR